MGKLKQKLQKKKKKRNQEDKRKKKKKTKPTSPSNAGPCVLLITIKCVLMSFFQSTLVDYTRFYCSLIDIGCNFSLRLGALFFSSRFFGVEWLPTFFGIQF